MSDDFKSKIDTLCQNQPNKEKPMRGQNKKNKANKSNQNEKMAQVSQPKKGFWQAFKRLWQGDPNRAQAKKRRSEYKRHRTLSDEEQAALTKLGKSKSDAPFFSPHTIKPGSASAMGLSDDFGSPTSSSSHGSPFGSDSGCGSSGGSFGCGSDSFSSGSSSSFDHYNNGF